MASKSAVVTVDPSVSVKSKSGMRFPTSLPTLAVDVGTGAAVGRRSGAAVGGADVALGVAGAVVGGADASGWGVEVGDAAGGAEPDSDVSEPSSPQAATTARSAAVSRIDSSILINLLPTPPTQTAASHRAGRNINVEDVLPGGREQRLAAVDGGDLVHVHISGREDLPDRTQTPPILSIRIHVYVVEVIVGAGSECRKTLLGDCESLSSCLCGSRGS